MATLIDPFKGTLIRSFLNQVPTLGYLGFRFDVGEGPASLGRPLGHFIFSRIGLDRTLFTNIFQRLQRANLEVIGSELHLLGEASATESKR